MDVPSKDPEQRRLAQQRYYEAHKDEILAERRKPNSAKKKWQNAEYAKRKAYIQQLKESSPCTDCGVYYPYYVMDFDHARGEKKCSLHDISRYSMEVIEAEIAKCDLVCSNCHRVRTHCRASGDAISSSGPKSVLTAGLRVPSLIWSSRVGSSATMHQCKS